MDQINNEKIPTVKMTALELFDEVNNYKKKYRSVKLRESISSSLRRNLHRIYIPPKQMKNKNEKYNVVLEILCYLKKTSEKPFKFRGLLQGKTLVTFWAVIRFCQDHGIPTSDYVYTVVKKINLKKRCWKRDAVFSDIPNSELFRRSGVEFNENEQSWQLLSKDCDSFDTSNSVSIPVTHDDVIELCNETQIAASEVQQEAQDDYVLQLQTIRNTFHAQMNQITAAMDNTIDQIVKITAESNEAIRLKTEAACEKKYQAKMKEYRNVVDDMYRQFDEFRSKSASVTSLLSVAG